MAKCNKLKVAIHKVLSFLIFWQVNTLNEILRENTKRWICPSKCILMKILYNTQVGNYILIISIMLIPDKLIFYDGFHIFMFNMRDVSQHQITLVNFFIRCQELNKYLYQHDQGDNLTSEIIFLLKYNKSVKKIQTNRSCVIQLQTCLAWNNWHSSARGYCQQNETDRTHVQPILQSDWSRPRDLHLHCHVYVFAVKQEWNFFWYIDVAENIMWYLSCHNMHKVSCTNFRSNESELSELDTKYGPSCLAWPPTNSPHPRLPKHRNIHPCFAQIIQVL